MLLTADVAEDVTEERTLAAVEREDEAAEAAEAADELSVDWALTLAKAAMARTRVLVSCMVDVWL